MSAWLGSHCLRDALRNSPQRGGVGGGGASARDRDRPKFRVLPPPGAIACAHHNLDCVRPPLIPTRDAKPRSALKVSLQAFVTNFLRSSVSVVTITTLTEAFPFSVIGSLVSTVSLRHTARSQRRQLQHAKTPCRQQPTPTPLVSRTTTSATSRGNIAFLVL